MSMMPAGLPTDEGEGIEPAIWEAEVREPVRGEPAIWEAEVREPVRGEPASGESEGRESIRGKLGARVGAGEGLSGEAAANGESGRQTSYGLSVRRE